MEKIRTACFGGLIVIAVMLLWRAAEWGFEFLAFVMLLIIATIGATLEWAAGLPGNLLLLVAGGAIACFLWVTRDCKQPEQ